MANFHDRLSHIVDKFAGGKAAAFAKRIGVTPSTFHNYIARGRYPNFETLEKIRNEFGVRLDWLVTGDGPMTDDAPPPQPKTLPPDEKLLTDALEVAHQALADRRIAFEPDQLARFVAHLYKVGYEAREKKAASSSAMTSTAGAMADIFSPSGRR